MKNILLAVFIVFSYAGDTPALFGEGIISTGDDEFGATISPDGLTCFFTKKATSTIQSSTVIICVSQLKNNKWSEPAIAPFSGRYKDFNPMFSADGNTLFFISNRLGDTKTTWDGDIWMVKKTGDSWSTPENIGTPVIHPVGNWAARPPPAGICILAQPVLRAMQISIVVYW